MAFKLLLIAEAETDYTAAVEWYKKQSVEAANRFLKELAGALSMLEVQPMLYGYYFRHYRRISLKSFPYKSVYETDGDKVIIHAVYHSSKDDAGLRKRLP